MILKFINSIQNTILTTYHIRIDFKTREKKPTYYSLEILTELRSQSECDSLANQLQSQLIEKFDGCNQFINEVTSDTEKKRIETNFKSAFKKHVNMKFLFRQWVKIFQETEPIGFKTINITDNTIPNNGIKDYRVNILKSGEIPFSVIQNMFCVEIQTNEFKPTDEE